MNEPTLNSLALPFHDGEILAQQRAGVRSEIKAFAAQAIRSYMPEQHREFFENLPFIVLAARDNKQRPWASIVCGQPGFIQSPDAQTLAIKGALSVGDALSDSLSADKPIGLLGIMLDARRRNRMNGRIAASNSDGISVRVDQSFGNCPQYISARQWVDAPADETPSPVRQSKQLSPELQRLVTTADTLFLASGHQGSASIQSNGMDASHRGGPAGFVQVVSAERLLLPDYAGNKFFNTIGNLVSDPGLGLLFVDFESGSMLQVSGQAEIDWDSENLKNFPGAQRLIGIDIEAVVFLENALPIRWGQRAGGVRELNLVSRHAESSNVTSFCFAARDHGALAPFTAGQHLPIELRFGDGKSVPRSYSLSGATDSVHYRISVKRQENGVASNYLHDELQPGDWIQAGFPAGDFVLTEQTRPVVLISAGVGVTPMISLLHALTNSDRPVTFVQGARNSEYHPFANEVSEILNQHSHIAGHIAYSQPLAHDVAGQHFDHHGRIDRQLLSAVLEDTDLDADFYLCGPPMMLADLGAWLADKGVLDSQIHIESF